MLVPDAKDVGGTNDEIGHQYLKLVTSIRHHYF